MSKPDPVIGLCWGTLIQASLIELIELSGRHGFPNITVAPHQYLESLQAGETAQSLRRRLADARVQVCGIDSLSRGLPGVPEGSMPMGRYDFERVDPQTAFRIAEDLGAPFITLIHYNAAPVPLEELAEAVGDLCRQAAPHGVTMAMEFMPNGGFSDIHRTAKIAQTCGESNCKVLVDNWHLARTGGGVSDIQSLAPGIIGQYQLGDRIEPEPDAVYVPLTGRDLPGEGELDLWPIVEASLANNPDLTIEVEVFSAELQALDAPAAAARVAGAVGKWLATRPD